MREALAHYQKSLETQPNNPQILANLAWLLATCREASVRNGAGAVELAQRANQLSGGQDAMILRTLAAAYAEAGRFAEAITTAQRALELATAQTLVRGRYPTEFDNYIKDMIYAVVHNVQDSQSALDLAAHNITDVLRRTTW